MGRIRQDWGLFARRYVVKGKKVTVWWYYIYDPSGKRHQLSTSKLTKQEAHNEVNRRLAAGTALPEKAIDDSLGPTVATAGTTIWDWDGDYIQGRLLKGVLTKSYVEEQAVRFRAHIASAIGERRLATVTVGELEAIFLALARRLAAKTVNNVYSAAKTVWDEYFRQEIIDKNPFHRMSQFEVRSSARSTLEPDDAFELLERRWWRDDVSWAINVTAAATGSRVAELCALPIGRVLADRVRIEAEIRAGEGLVQTTKTGELGKRWSAIPPHVRKILEPIMAGRAADEFVFRAEVGNANQHTKVRQWSKAHIGLEVPVKQLKAAVAKLNAHRQEVAAATGEEPRLLPAVVFHSWRHFVVSQLSGAKCGPDAVSLQVGHAIEGVKAKYLHQTEAHVQDCLAALTVLFKDVNFSDR